MLEPKRLPVFQPAFLLAFAYDPQNALSELVTELNAIQSALTSEAVTPDVLWSANAARIEERILIYQDRLRLFHFSGHAGKGELYLNDPAHGASFTFSSGMAGLARLAPNLKLVFLNGCSTNDQAQFFLDAGAHAVIATTRPIRDSYALKFAVKFYKTFTNARARLTLQRAFDAADSSYLMDYGPFSAEMREEAYRSGNIDTDESPDGPLFVLHLNPKKTTIANSIFEDWLKPEDDQAKKETITKIKALIEKAKLKEALELYKTLNAEQGSLLLGQYTQAYKQNLLGVFDGNYNNYIAKLSYNLLNLIQEV